VKDWASERGAQMRRTRIGTRFVRLDEARRNAFVTPVTPEVAGSSPVGSRSTDPRTHRTPNLQVFMVAISRTHVIGFRPHGV
jgi:hypothetical protein